MKGKNVKVLTIEHPETEVETKVVVHYKWYYDPTSEPAEHEIEVISFEPCGRMQTLPTWITEEIVTDKLYEEGDLFIEDDEDEEDEEDFSDDEYLRIKSGEGRDYEEYETETEN